MENNLNSQKESISRNKKIANEKKEKSHFFLRNIRRDDSPFKNFISILIGYADTILLYNIFFILTSLGIITIGPGLVSMTECFNEFVGNKTDHRYRRYFQKFKKNFNFENCLLGVIFTGFVALICYLFIFFFINTPKHVWLIAPWVLSNVFLVYLVSFTSFYILMRIRIDLPIKIVITNSLKLAAGAIKSVIFCLLSFGVMIVVPAVFFEYTFPLFILIEFSMTTLACMMSVYSEVDKLCIYSDKDLDTDLNEVEEKKANIKLDLIDENFLKDDYKKKDVTSSDFNYYEVTDNKNNHDED